MPHDSPSRLRNRDAGPLYAIVGVGYGIALLCGMFVPQRWEVLGFVVVVGLLSGRYLLPLTAEPLDGGIRFRWPLRTVVVTAENLVTARVLEGATRSVGLRVRRSVRWGVVADRYEDSARLCAALSSVVEAAKIRDDDRRAVLSELRRRATDAGR